ncbi:MAG: DUF4209 domain-containing protein [Actinomycetota bacterium]
MDEIDDAELEVVLAQACSDAATGDFQSIVSVASALRAEAGDEDDPRRALIAALEYHLTLPEERRGAHGPFGPMIETSKGSYPAPVGTVDGLIPGTYQLWERAAALAPLDLVKARFLDLLWVARFGDQPHQFVGAAIDAYITAASGGFGHPVERSEALQRAVELASQTRDRDRRGRAVTATVAMIEAAIASEDRMPGVALPLLAMLVGDRPDRRPSELEQLVQKAIDRFGDDPWNLQAALELQARLVPPEERKALHERQVEGFRELASQTTGLVRYSHLQHAIELAEGFGLHGLADSLRHEVEAITEDELELKEFSAEVSLPREQVDRYIDWFVGKDDLESALRRFGSHIPSGDPDKNRQQVEELMAEHPIQYLFTRMTIGPNNSLTRSTQGPDAQAEQALIDREAQQASLFSLFAVEILERIRERYGPIAANTDWLKSDLIDVSVASKIRRAIELYEADDPDSAASVLAPRLERIVRRLASAVGLTVTRSPDRHGRSGGVKGLGDLLGTLEGFLPEPTRRYLKVLLSEVTGLNLRNRIGHGLDDEIAKREAALLIHAVCHARLLVPTEGSAS